MLWSVEEWRVDDGVGSERPGCDPFFAHLLSHPKQPGTSPANGGVLEPKWLEPKWLEPKWLRLSVVELFHFTPIAHVFITHLLSAA